MFDHTGGICLGSPRLVPSKIIISVVYIGLERYIGIRDGRKPNPLKRGVWSLEGGKVDFEDVRLSIPATVTDASRRMVIYSEASDVGLFEQEYLLLA